MLALTRLPARSLAECQLTFVDRSAVDHSRALLEHAAYRETLLACGAQVETLPADDALPDCVFIEDTATVLDELAILCRLGAESRRPETLDVAARLRSCREMIFEIEPPATLEGGDVLCLGRTLLVGLSSRTNRQGIEQLADFTRTFGYQVAAIRVHGSLHLKTACTALPDGRLLLNRAWIDATPLREYEQIVVPESEPWGANVVVLNHQVITAASNCQTVELISEQGFQVHPVELAEFAKAEGGATCLSLLFPESVG